ncbi:carbon starvation protein, predicted membrane protein [Desulfosporosinus acidiphilus SJ4]|uniref:Carbon starvation protein, predicted membrane protein n=1 Tax=Desulfosporosinus acidiphilus (strain DSM 22704 / JCM 16185 / SJ4) TaxID=646529 RepID=I4DC35_DESAJ|nr:carbon starvation protein A [Desulfosporosinus acidiphilus]AFM43359.1 carbon starvation protein, predicted membrane protein [Desulfosporosinus acidiphilus SJ4]
MHAIYLVIAAVCVLLIGYRLYGTFMATKVLAVDPRIITPAKRLEDGHDFVPTNRWVTFGHHFAAIAAAGPLVGPVLAAQFGYLPGTLWILIGGVLGGAVHDMVVLFASVRHDGKSLAQIAKKEIGPVTGAAASLAVLFILIITMAGLSIVIVSSLNTNPWGAFTVAMTIPIAIFIGIYMRFLRPGKLGEASIIGVALILLAVALGPTIKSSALAPFFNYSVHAIEIALPVYAFIAAALPVWLLLAPRDYLSSYLKIGTIGALALGIIFVNPVLQMPPVTKFINGGGPIIAGKVWPFVFITIACGAMSGFHSLIAAGTTPKMLENEKDIKIVGFGAMLMESFVAIMAMIAASVLPVGDYFAINTTPAVFAHLGMHVDKLPMLSKLIGLNVAGRPGGSVSLAVGMSYVFSSIPGLSHLVAYWYQFAIMFEAVFILTAVDAGTRAARYVVQDMIGVVIKPFKKINWWPGAVISAALVSFAWGYLLYGGNISTVWPLFGVSNQLLASLAMVVGTSIILKSTGRISYALTTFIPFVFLFVTTLDASYFNVTKVYLPQHMTLNVILSVIMAILALIIVADAFVKWTALIRDKQTLEIQKARHKEILKDLAAK